MKNNNSEIILSIDPYGLTCKRAGETEIVRWLDIKKISAYKVDLLTFDEIQLQILFRDLEILLTEESDCWRTVVEKLKLVFPQIPKDWEFKIAKPAFATNFIVLYEKIYPIVFADFNNTDEQGRVRLNTAGSIEDIKKLGSQFKSDIYVLLDSRDGLQVFGLVKYSEEEKIWVAEIDWDNFIEAGSRMARPS